jgi:hypothetical protein
MRRQDSLIRTVQTLGLLRRLREKRETGQNGGVVAHESGSEKTETQPLPVGTAQKSRWYYDDEVP